MALARNDEAAAVHITVRRARWALVLALVAVLVLALAPLEGSIATGSSLLNHFLAFFVLALLLDHAFPQRFSVAQKILLLVGFGVLIELLQVPLAQRQFSLLDIAADSAGVTAYFAAAALWSRLPLPRLRRFSQGRSD
jgi:VanZ family protein